MTAEETLSKELDIPVYELEFKDEAIIVRPSEAISAMLEYAKQEAIEFARWYFKTDWALIEDGAGKYMNIETSETKTMDEIYSLYTAAKQKIK